MASHVQRGSPKVTVRIPAPLLDRLEPALQRERMTYSDAIREGIELWLASQPDKAA